MALGKQLPIRLDTDTDARLESLAGDLGTSKSALVRMLADTFVAQAILPDGSVMLPPNWSELLSAADGRAKINKTKQSLL